MRTSRRHVLALVLAITFLAAASPASAEVAPAASASAPAPASLSTNNSVGAMVSRLYFAFFDRAPDPTGYAFWVQQVTGGRPIADAAESFVLSDEFVATYGSLTDAEFIDQIYLNVLGRAGDTQGVTFWNGQLSTDTRTRGEVVLGMSDSSEFRARVEATFPDKPLVRLYCAYLLRMPEAGGRAFWRQQYSWGTPLSEISENFALADEFIRNYGSLSNRDFVTLIYANVQNRAAEPGGLAFWTTALSNGTFTRGQVMLEFSESDEYKNRFPTSGEACPEQTFVPADASPTANDDTGSVAVNGSTTIDWDANDTLVDNATLDSIDTTGTTGGVVDNDNGTFTYTAPASPITDTFTYTVCDDDPTPSCDDATVTVVVNAVGDGNDPIANNDGGVATSGVAVIIDWADNDSLVDGATVTTGITVDATSAEGGTVVDNGDGTFTYTSDAGFVGTDTFKYQVCDDDPTCDLATVTVSVSNGGDPAGMSCELYITPPRVNDGETVLSERFIFYTKFEECYQVYEAYAGSNELVIEYSNTTIDGVSVNPTPYEVIGHEVFIDNDDYLPEGLTNNIVVTSVATISMEVPNGTSVPTRTPLVTMDVTANYRISDGSGDIPAGAWIGINGVETVTYHVDPNS